ncbi:hypothetical protein CRG98_036588, partial [Punica granatum]
MAFTSTLRFSSLLLRSRFTAPLCPVRFSWRLSELRFYSVPSSRVLRARRREGPIKAEQGGNGSVVVKDKDGNNGERIMPAELHKEATDAYMAYAMSVLLGRALPDVRDGLKPVHRRILILEAYRTGRGRIVVRGKTDIELLDSKSKRTAIIIKEIPYQTNKASLVEKIAELVENK